MKSDRDREHNGVLRRVAGDGGPVSYRARYRGADGRWHSRTFDQAGTARAWVDEQRAAVRRGGWVDPAEGRTRFGVWAERWLDEVANPDLKPKTRVGYESLLETHLRPAFGDDELHDVTAHRIQGWVNRMRRGGLSPSRVRQAHQLLRAILQAAVSARLISANPAAGTNLPRLPRDHSERRFLSPAELHRLVEAAGDRWGALVMTLGLGGLRWGEAAALRVARCELLHRRLVVAESLAEVRGELIFGATKSGATRTVAIPDSLRDRLATVIAGRGPHELVFPGSDGGPLRHSTFSRRVWPRMKADAGVPGDLRIHDLRHTAASLLIAAGRSPKQVQAHLGHSSITVTMDTYAHLYPGTLGEVADSLEAAFQTGAAAAAAGNRVLGAYSERAGTAGSPGKPGRWR